MHYCVISDDWVFFGGGGVVGFLGIKVCIQKNFFLIWFTEFGNNTRK